MRGTQPSVVGNPQQIMYPQQIMPTPQQTCYSPTPIPSARDGERDAFPRSSFPLRILNICLLHSTIAEVFHQATLERLGYVDADYSGLYGATLDSGSHQKACTEPSTRAWARILSAAALAGLLAVAALLCLFSFSSLAAEQQEGGRAEAFLRAHSSSREQQQQPPSIVLWTLSLDTTLCRSRCHHFVVVSFVVVGHVQTSDRVTDGPHPVLFIFGGKPGSVRSNLMSFRRRLFVCRRSSDRRSLGTDEDSPRRASISAVVSSLANSHNCPLGAHSAPVYPTLVIRCANILGLQHR